MTVTKWRRCWMSRLTPTMEMFTTKIWLMTVRFITGVVSFFAHHLYHTRLAALFAASKHTRFCTFTLVLQPRRPLYALVDGLCCTLPRKAHNNTLVYQPARTIIKTAILFGLLLQAHFTVDANHVNQEPPPYCSVLSILLMFQHYTNKRGILLSTCAHLHLFKRRPSDPVQSRFPPLYEDAYCLPLTTDCYL